MVCIQHSTVQYSTVLLNSTDIKISFILTFCNYHLFNTDGVLNTLSAPALQQAAATIATVEARHASYLSLLNQAIPFPNVLDPVKSPAQVVTDISSILASCNNPSAIPLQEPLQRSNLTSAHSETNDELQNDIAVLQYALALEHLESTFYNQYAGITSQEFQQAGYSSNTYDYIALIRSHESQHVQILSSVLKQLGATPVPACNYTFPPTISTVQFINYAAALENTGVSAYDGTVNAITNATLQQAAVQIATVEARHAAYLNNLLQQSPFPNATDVAETPSQVAAIASQFISSCPYDLNSAINSIKLSYSGQGGNGSNSGATAGTSTGGSGTSGIPPPSSGSQHTTAASVMIVVIGSVMLYGL